MELAENSGSGIGIIAQLLCAEVAWSHSIQLYMVWMHALSMLVHKHDTVFQYRMMMR